MKEKVRYIIGFILGFIICIILVPFGLVKLSHLDYLLYSKILIPSDLLRYIICSILFLVGAWFAIRSNIFLLTVGKGGPLDGFGITISPRTRKLVTVGPYKYCRNPMVFGAFSLYLSIVVFLNSILGFILLLFFLVLGITYLRFSEEKRLIKDFGNKYLEYRKKVPMIFPIKRIRK